MISLNKVPQEKLLPIRRLILGQIQSRIRPITTRFLYLIRVSRNHFNIPFIAPVTSKITIVNDQVLSNAGSFGVEKAIYDITGNVISNGKKMRAEYGGYLRLIYSKNDFTSEFMKNITFTTRLDMFSNYLQNPQNIDVSWETLISLKVNKYISVNINTHLLYDDDIKINVDSNNDGVVDKAGPRTQFKEILGVGFSYKF